MEPHERLSGAMNRRRLDLRLQWKQVAAGAGISPESLGAIRRGEYRPSELTARGLDDTLRWKDGSVRAVLAGGEPTPLTENRAEAGAAQGSGTAFDATVRTEAAGRSTTDPAVKLIATALATADLDAGEAASRAGIDPDGWFAIMTGRVRGSATEIARMAHVVGVESFHLREAGRADAANALQDLVNELENGHKAPEQLTGELQGLDEEIRALLQKRGLDPKSRQMDVLNPAIVGFAEMMLRYMSIERENP